MTKKTRKKRSKKQLANDRRLGHMEKKRGKKKAKKKAAKRRNPNKRYYVIATMMRVPGGKSLRFYNGAGWGTVKDYAKYGSQSAAKKVANGLGRTVVVAPSTTTTKKLIEALSPGKG